MNDGQYTNLRNYLEEIASQNRQILAELRRGNELAAGKQAAQQPATKTKVGNLASVGPEKVERQLETETGKDFAKTGANPPTWAETDKPAVPRQATETPAFKPQEPVEMATRLPAETPNTIEPRAGGKAKG